MALALLRLGVADRRLTSREFVAAFADTLRRSTDLQFRLRPAHGICRDRPHCGQRTATRRCLLGRGQSSFNASGPLYIPAPSGVGTDLYRVEAQYLGAAVQVWLGKLDEGLWQTISFAGLRTAEFVSSDPALPLLMLIALAGLVILRRHFDPVARRRLYFVFLAGIFPFALVLPWSTAALARGYLIYCTFGMFVAISASVLSRTPLLVRWSIVAVIAGCQVAWIAGALSGSPNTVQAYIFGSNSLDGLAHAYAAPRAEAFSLTGQEPLPVAVGGKAHASLAGAVVPASEVKLEQSRRTLRGWSFWIMRLYLLVPIVIGTWCFGVSITYTVLTIAALAIAPPITRKLLVLKASPYPAPTWQRSLGRNLAHPGNGPVGARLGGASNRRRKRQKS